ncbi:MAG: hypothetical protein K8R88_11230 [Armatimonadetes bacterium]|nr:hypothetical protein [Armatimonadota bacterium]
MEIKRALKGQYKAGLAMLRECIEVCPEDMWSAGEHPRTFWRIAYHTLFCTHLYLMTEEAAFVPWELNQSQARILWDDDEEGVPPVETTYSQAQMLEYLGMVEAGVDGWVELVDLDSDQSGFSWYSIPKLDHQILNVRHLGVHVGQLSELLMARGIDTGWISRRD